MKISKMTAIIDEFRLKDVEDALIRRGVNGVTLHQVRDRGHHVGCLNFRLFKHVQMEVYAKTSDANDIARLIVDSAHVNADSEGLVCVVPFTVLFLIHGKLSATDSDFQLHE